ncbi:MAG: hypothetical protein ACXWLR_09975 [Myxococcales bacterium]
MLLSASTRDGCSWRGSLATIDGCALPDLHPDSPGILVIGATVAIADRLKAETANLRRLAVSDDG